MSGEKTQKICEHCTNTFNTNKKNKVYCSSTCRLKEKSEREKRRHIANINEIHERKRLYYLENKERILPQMKIRYLEKRDELLEYSKEWIKKNRDKRLEYGRRYRKRYPNGPFTTLASKRTKEYRNKIVSECGNFNCEHCGSLEKRIECHHIVHRAESVESEELHADSNLIGLCPRCHKAFHHGKISRDELIEQRGLEVLFNKSL